jgi:hypothetical protein
VDILCIVGILFSRYLIAIPASTALNLFDSYGQPSRFCSIPAFSSGSG